MTDDRFVQLETRLAHQEHLIDTLNDAVTDQQIRISGLEQTCRALAEQLRSVLSGDALPAPGDERPPHY